MFGFQDSNRMRYGFSQIIDQIANNKDGSILTHKEVRALARYCMPVVNQLGFSNQLDYQIEFLLGCLSQPGIPHYDRCAIANRIKVLIKDFEDKKAQAEQQASGDLWF